LSVERFEPFVRRLFAADPGRWLTVADCCAGLPALPDFAAEVFAEHAESFFVTYLPWPGTPDNDPYALVLFLNPEEFWSTKALYNRAILGIDRP
jgi:hypothetical protein